MSAGAAERFFVDTNLLLYALAGADPEKQGKAQEWLNALWEARTGRLSWQVLNEFYANAGPKLKLATQIARRVVRDYALWQPLGMDSGLIERAWHWMDHASLSFWDALILASAEKLDCRTLLTEDFQHNRTFGTVRIVNPFAESPTRFFAE